MFRTKFGIFNHLTDSEPMAANKFTEKSKFLDGFIFEGRLRNFIYKDISKVTGMSFDDYLCRPRYEIELIDSIVEQIGKERAKQNQQLLDDLEKQKNQDPTPK